MSQQSWRFMVLMSLTGPGASRIYTEGLLREIATRYRPSITEPTFQSLLSDLLETSALSLFKEKVFLNKLADPSVSEIEAWSYLYREGVLSMQSVLHEANVFQDSHKTITIVVPTKWERIHRLDEQWNSDFKKVFVAYGLPKKYFTPDFADEIVIKDAEPFPYFTVEKALLDWLLVAAKNSGEKMPPVNIDISLFNIPKLYCLSEQMEIKGVLDQYLNEVHLAATKGK